MKWFSRNTEMTSQATQQTAVAQDNNVVGVCSTQILKMIADTCDRAATGDLEARITPAPEDKQLYRVVKSINAMLDLADSFVRETAAAMQHCSDGQFHRPILLRGLKGAYRQSALIINRAGVRMKENSASLKMVETMAQENTSSVNTVAAACEELNATAGQIASETKNTSALTREAVTQAGEAQKVVNGLNEAFREIQEVVSVIQEVAKKTNLLALNATIEASRAGEQGTRFGVVANEIKSLSVNTAGATERISRQIELMQSSVFGVSTIIESMTAKVQQIDQATSVVTHNVEEQVAATQEISRNLSDISEKTRYVSEQLRA